MDQLIVQLIILVLALVIAGIKSLRLRPERLLEAAPNPESKTALKRVEALLHLQQVLQSNLLILNIFLLLLLALSNFGLFQIIGLAFLWLIAVHLLAAAQSVHNKAQRFASKHLDGLFRLAVALQPALKILDDSRFFIVRREQNFSSKAQLLDAIDRSKEALTKEERKQLRAVLEKS